MSVLADPIELADWRCECGAVAAAFIPPVYGSTVLADAPRTRFRFDPGRLRCADGHDVTAPSELRLSTNRADDYGRRPVTIERHDGVSIVIDHGSVLSLIPPVATA